MRLRRCAERLAAVVVLVMIGRRVAALPADYRVEANRRLGPGRAALRRIREETEDYPSKPASWRLLALRRWRRRAAQIRLQRELILAEEGILFPGWG